ncbi:hypothetical protein SPFM14_00230 [Salmonella phage SPFM14]|nr:hypothetical protein SPFM14_00230 [Salmonella phage SPFM14]
MTMTRILTSEKRLMELKYKRERLEKKYGLKKQQAAGEGDVHIEKLIEAHDRYDECVEAAKATELRILLYVPFPLSIVYRVRLNIAEWQMYSQLVQQFGSNTTDPLGMSSITKLKADYAEIPEAVFDEETQYLQTRKTSFCIAVRVLATPEIAAVQDSNIAVKGIGPKDLDMIEFFVGYASTLINYITAEGKTLVTSSLTFNKQTVLQLLSMQNVQALRPFLEQCIDRDISSGLEVKGLRNASMLEYVIAKPFKAKPVADLSTEIVKYLHIAALEPQFQNLQELVGSVQGLLPSFEATNLKNQLSSNCDSSARIRYCKGKRMPIPNMLAMTLARRSPVAAM